MEELTQKRDCMEPSEKSSTIHARLVPYMVDTSEMLLHVNCKRHTRYLTAKRSSLQPSMSATRDAFYLIKSTGNGPY